MTFKRVDANQGEIALAVRQMGGYWFDLHEIGHGFPDGLIYFHGRFILAEVKSQRGRLTKDEEAWHAKHPGVAVIVRSKEDVWRAMGVLDDKPTVLYEKWQA